MIGSEESLLEEIYSYCSVLYGIDANQCNDKILLWLVHTVVRYLGKFCFLFIKNILQFSLNVHEWKYFIIDSYWNIMFCFIFVQNPLAPTKKIDQSSSQP